MDSSTFQGIVFTDLSEAQALETQVDEALGYPKNGELHNGGTQCEGDTIHVSYISPHPTIQNKWVYFVWGDMVGAIPEGFIVEELSVSEWFPIIV